MMAIDITDMLRGAMKGEEPSTRENTPIPEAQAMELKEVFENYQKECPFKPGDLVTPRRNSWLKGTGLAHVVLEVFPEPFRMEPNDGSDIMGPSAFCRIDMRVAGYSDNRIVPWAAESWAYERWEPTGQ